jgi:hypothetical protein
VALTTADLRVLRDYLIASDALPVGQVTVIIPTARFEMTKRLTIRRNPGTLSRAKKPGPKRKAKVETPALTEEPCYFCKALVLVPDFRCAGCGEVVCDRCDEFAPWGKHDVHEHSADGSDDA